MKYQIQLIVDGNFLRPYILTDAGNGPEFATEDEGLGRIEYTASELEEGICDADRLMTHLIEFEEFFDEDDEGTVNIIILPID